MSPKNIRIAIAIGLILITGVRCSDMGDEITHGSNQAPVITSAGAVIAVETEHFEYHGTAIDPNGTIPSISYRNFPSWMGIEGDSLHGHALVGAADTSFWVIASDGLLDDTLEVTVTVVEAGALISFSGQVQPIFNANCLTSGCHGTGPSPSGGLRLVNYNSLMQGSNSGAVVIAHDPDNSILIRQLEGTRQPQMPFGQAPLEDSLIQQIRAWIEQGAEDN
jgi:hypothetical protein